MEQSYSTKRVVIVAITLATLAVSVPFLANRLNARATRYVPISRTHRSSPPTNDTEEFYGFVKSLPSHSALVASLEALANDSTGVLQAAAMNDAELLSLAVGEYRTTLSQVGNNFTTLVDRIGRDRAEAALEEIVTATMDSAWPLKELVLSTQTQEQE